MSNCNRTDMTDSSVTDISVKAAQSRADDARLAALRRICAVLRDAVNAGKAGGGLPVALPNGFRIENDALASRRVAFSYEVLLDPEPLQRLAQVAIDLRARMRRESAAAIAAATAMANLRIAAYARILPEQEEQAY